MNRGGVSTKPERISNRPVCPKERVQVGHGKAKTQAEVVAWRKREEYRVERHRITQERFSGGS